MGQSFKIIAIVLVLTLNSVSSALASGEPPFLPVTKRCETLLESEPKELRTALRDAVEAVAPKPKAHKYIRLRGYAFLIGTMVGSAALTTQLTSALPASGQFLAQLITQISTIGIYVMGAPIWEPISSALKNWSYRMLGNHERAHGDTKALTLNAELDQLWIKTQGTYSSNRQMSRNVLNSFILAVKQSFYEAHRAMNETDPVLGRAYALDQICEAAIRMRILFADVSPIDRSVALAVRTSFVDHHVFDRENFYADALKRIETLDEEAKNAEVLQYYKRALATWLM